MTETIWEGKYKVQGRKVAPPRVELPLQTVEKVSHDRDRMQNLYLPPVVLQRPVLRNLIAQHHTRWP